MAIELTHKALVFCEYYVIDGNGTEAAIKAGYSKKTAYAAANRLLKKVEVIQRINELRNKISERNEVTADMLIQELKALAFTNASDYYSTDWNIKDLNKLTEEQKKAIAGVKKVTTISDGMQREVMDIKFHNKLEAIEKLAKHIGFFEKDNNQKQIFKVTMKNAGS